MKTVSIIILNFNGIKDTMQCLKSIEKLQVTSYKLQVIVVDNGSTEQFKIQDSRFKIQDLRVIRNEENLGFSGGNNVGIRYALRYGADYVMLLNNDTIVDPNLVSELIKVANSDQKIGIVAPKIYFAKGHEFHKDRYKENEKGRVIWYAGGVMDWNNVIGSHRGVDEVDCGQYNKTEQTDFTSGCCMLIKKDVFAKIEFLDERYFLYYEDSDFNIRAKKAEYKIMYAPLAFLWHINAGSTGGSGSNMQDYFITRNRILFGITYAPLKTKVALIAESLRLFLYGRKWQRQGILDFYTMRFGKGGYSL